MSQATDTSQCQAEETTLDVAFNELAANSMVVAVEAMEQRHPGLTINADPSPFTGYEDLTQQIVADIAVGNRPDVIIENLTR